jgi:hypothetical protein
MTLFWFLYGFFSDEARERWEELKEWWLETFD